jgi:hypothetical protein
MALITNTFTTYSAIGLREDLSDIIYNISPTETPFMTAIAREKATAVYHEWQTDALETPNANNAQIQGDDISTFDAVVPTVRLGNYTQISRKTVVISATEEAVDKAGRKSEKGYQVAKKGKSLKRDLETILLSNQARTAGTVGAAPAKLASVLAWIKTNVDVGATGTNPAGDGTNARGDGTQRAFTAVATPSGETLLQNVLSSIWQNSGDEPDFVLVNSNQKKNITGFQGNNTRYINAEEEKLVNSIDVYVYDFGSVEIKADRFMRQRDALIINSDLWGLAWLRPINMTELAKTGDNDKTMILGEYTLTSRNEAGSGLVADLL